MLDTMFSEARSYAQKFHSDWDENVKYLLGDQPVKSRPQGFAAIVDNQIWRITQQAAALLTDTKPNIEVNALPQDESWYRMGLKLKKVIEAIWTNNQVDRELVRCVYDLYICGVAFLKCWWDPRKDWELGDVAISRIDPRYMWVDPSATDLHDAEYICYRVPVSLWELKRRFDPERVSRVEPDSSLSSFSSEESPPHQVYQFQVPVQRAFKKTQPSAVPKVWLEEWWIRDPTVEPLTGLPMYPAGRMITRAGKVILADVPNPYWDPWPGPWVKIVVNPLSEGPFGVPEISQLRDLNDAINVLESLAVDNVRFMTNGVWIADEDALPEDMLRKLPATKPGTVITKRPGRQVTRDVGTAVPGQFIELLRELKMAQHHISGLAEPATGRAPRGITAQGAIEALQMASQATIRIKAREIEAGLVELGQRIISRVFQFYTRERVVDYLGEDGTRTVTWDPAEFAQLVTGGEVPSGFFLGPDERRSLLRQFRVRISPGSSLALSKERQWASQLALFSAGLIDREAVLEALDYPNRDAITRRMQAVDMVRTQIQAQRPRRSR